MIKIDGARALELLEAAVAERGADYVYPHELCEYTLDHQPACIVGVALAKAGVDPELLVSNGVGSIRELSLGDRWAQRFSPPLTFTITEDAVSVWAAAQEVQDSHGTWGQALEAARAAL